MISLKDFLAVANYRITEGSEFQWECYGPNAYSLDSWVDAPDSGGFSLCAIFDTQTQEVFEVQVFDYEHDRAYRLFNPSFKEKYFAECDTRSIPKNEAYDDVMFVDLDVDEDFLDKAAAIVAGEEYDLRVQMPLDLPKEIIDVLFREAHRRDITFNALITEILQDAIDRVKKGTL